VLVVDGRSSGWVPDGFEILAQRGEGLGERLAAAFSDVGAPSLVVGMDTPQVTPELLREGLNRLESPGVDAVLGPAHDGGYWALGLSKVDAGVFSGVPMSTSGTAEAQLNRLRSLGLATELLPPLRDVDFFEDAEAVSAECEGSRFQQEFQRVAASLGRTTRAS
jgi:uncharacterized protein